MKQRILEPERMDDPSLDPFLLQEALKGIKRLNKWSFSRESLWNEIVKLARKYSGRTLKILDVATGGGDNPIGIWKKARKAGIPVEIHACDFSATAVNYAAQQAAKKNAPVHFFQLDVCEEPIPEGYDIIMSSLFLHHLNESQTLLVLKKMAAAAKKAVLVSDLTRHWAGLWLAILSTRLLCSSPVVHEDGPQSVRAAYTVKEIRELAEKASLRNFKIFPQWPFRYLFLWESAS